MRYGVGWHSLLSLGVLALSLGASACGGDDDEGEKGSTQVGDLATECARYCNHQGGCPMDPTPASCEQSCQGIGEMFPECVQQWNALNHCMAEDDLICDSTGFSATRACVSLADAYGNCLFGG